MGETRVKKWALRIPPGKSIKTREGQTITNRHSINEAKLTIEARVRKDADSKKEESDEKSDK